MCWKSSLLAFGCLMIVALVSAQDAQYVPITVNNADTVQPINIVQVEDVFPILDFHPQNSRELAIASSDGRISILMDATADQTTSLYWHAHQGGVNDIKYSLDGSRLFSAGADGRVLSWDATIGELLEVIDTHERPALAVNLHPEGEIIAVGYQSGLVRMFDIHTGEKLISFFGYNTAVIDVEFHENRQFFGFAQNNSRIHVYRIGDLREEEITLDDILEMGEVEDFEFIPAAVINDEPPLLYVITLITSATNFRSVRSSDIFRVGHYSEFGPQYESNSKITYPAALDYNSDGSLIVTGGHINTGGECGGFVCVVEILHGTIGLETDLTVIHTFEPHDAWMTDIIFSEDNRFVASASMDGSVVISAAK